MSKEITRRELMKAAGMGTIALGLGIPAIQDRKRRELAFRFVFMPCIHFRLDLRSPEGLAAALKAVSALDPRPDFIQTGGDVCHDLRTMTPTDAQKRLDEFNKVWHDNTAIKSLHSLGNHEVPGWSNAVNLPLEDPQGGYKVPMKALGMAATSYVHEHEGWRFIVAHNVVQTTPGAHTGVFPPEVLAMLKSEV
jgi:hypothetical protein